MMKRWLLSLFACCLAAAAMAQGNAFSGRITLKFQGALSAPFGEKLTPEKALSLYATCDQGKWDDVWGQCMNFNKAMHLGTGMTGTVTPQRMVLRINMAIGSDAWVKGGDAVYDVTVQRDNGVLTGTFTGTNVGPKGTVAVSGTVSGEELPPQTVDPNWQPIQIGEHPRMLFRKSELAALRAKAKTPFGQAAVDLLKGSNDPVALGMMYQLTGDKAYADRAIDATQQVMDNRNGGAFALGRFWGYRTILVGNAYDLCADAWPAEFKERVENYLDWIIYKCLYRGHRVGTVNWTPGSNYTMVIQPGNATGALALWGERGSWAAPLKPLAPRTEIPRPQALTAAVPAGVPVAKLEPGKQPTAWLYAGPFEQHVNQHAHPYYDYQDVDCLATAGGEAGIRPTPGMTVRFKSQQVTWQAMSIETQPDLFFSQFDGGRKSPLLNSSRISGNRENTHVYFYTVLEVEQPGYYELRPNYYEGRCVLGGLRLENGEIAYLAAGRYPLLVPVAMADGEYQGNFTAVPATEEKAKAYYADPARQQAYARNLAQYEKDLAAYKAADGRNLRWMQYADTLRHLNYLNIQFGMGDGGFQGEGEGYTLECSHVEHDFACEYLHAFGRTITGRPDISHFAPRYVMTTMWNTDGRQTRPVNQTYGRGGGITIDARYLPRAIALCPQEWQPALLWFWLKRANTTAAEMRTYDGAKRVLGSGEYDDMARVQAFINYPLNVEPQSPDARMPHTWYAEGKGLCVFRDNWKDDDSIVAQIYAKQGEGNGWNQPEAAGFQIRGLGHEWAWKNNDAMGKVGTRWFDNVVLLPDDDMETMESSKVVYFKGDDKTGSGSVTINLDNLYQSKGAKISGIRAFAADYSGAAGVPALFAVVDHITGGQRKIWNFQLPRDGGQLAIDGNTFTITNGNTSLKATFIGPADVKITPASLLVTEDGYPGVSKTHQSLQAASADGKNGDFFVIMTLQQGNAPAVTVDGAGLAARVTVGGQTVTFDGQKLLLAK